VNKASQQLAHRYREKLEFVTQNKIKTVEWLVQPIKNPEWERKAKEILV